MSIVRIILRIVIVLAFMLVGAYLGFRRQIKFALDRPSVFCSLAKVVAGGNLSSGGPQWKEVQQDFYGTIRETLESAEMKRRAMERVRALNPDVAECDVGTRAVQTPGSAIITIMATGAEPKYTRLFLDALLDEFIAFRQSIREQSQGKVLQQFLQEVVTKQKAMEDTLARLEKARAKVDTLSVKSDIERLVARLSALRNQRDDLRLKIKALKDGDAGRAGWQTELSTTEAGISEIEKDLARWEPDLAELRTLQQQAETSKLAYEKLFSVVENIQAIFNTSADYVAVQERATPAFEQVEDWVMPAAAVALAGGLLFGFTGLLLSLILVRAPRPSRIPEAI